MGKFGVTQEKEAELMRRMDACGLREADLEERFITTGGPGGQHANRSSTGVYLKHGPSGSEIKMTKARSQALNRFYARRRLCELLEGRTMGESSPAEKRREKLRKQKARRKRRSRSGGAGE